MKVRFLGGPLGGSEGEFSEPLPERVMTAAPVEVFASLSVADETPAMPDDIGYTLQRSPGGGPLYVVDGHPRIRPHRCPECGLTHEAPT